MADGVDGVPALTDGAVRLRSWRVDDAPALAAAWADDEVRRFTRVPNPADEATAARWIAGAAQRWADRVALDLVVSSVDDDVVLGEVGLGPFAAGRNAAALGYWVAVDARGRGVATAAARLLADWALDPGGLALSALVATTDPANPASAAVLRGAGFVPLADRDGRYHWVRRA
ncbi:MAG: GNAT family N-acetyltransferase [Acidimicrobiales bacterium]|nr:GNAT family N-acetyltransferase [Acidimicrobiales bacterium]